MAPQATAPNPAAQSVGRLPQTTQSVAADGPFIRYAEEAVALAYSTAGIVFTNGAVANLPLTAVPGFLRALWLTVQATGGSGTTTAAVAAADAPYSVIQQLTFRDSSGQALYPAVDGYGLWLINLYSGMCGQGGQQNPSSLASFSAIAVSGNFLFKLWVPFEFNSSGYCSLPSDNSAELPKLQVNFAAANPNVYTTSPAPTVPTLTFTVEESYWAVPNNMPDLAPFDVGASAQWLLTTSGQNPPSNAYMRVLDQGVGQFVHTKIFVYRDSTGARADLFPASLETWIDQFQYRFERQDSKTDLVQKQFNLTNAGNNGAAGTRPVGVIPWTWRNSIQDQVSKADDAENILITTGSTKFEVGGSWGTNANQPAQLTCYTGMIFPGDSGYPFDSQAH